MGMLSGLSSLGRLLGRNLTKAEGKAAAKGGILGSMIVNPITGAIRAMTKPLLTAKWLFRANKNGRVNIFKNIAKRIKVRGRVLRMNTKSFLKNPLRPLRNMAMMVGTGLAMKYAIKALTGSDGNRKPSESKTPDFNATKPTELGTSPVTNNAPNTAGLIDKTLKSNAKSETATKLAEAKAELTSATKAANQAKPFVSKVPTKLEEIHARGKGTDEKLDAVIKLLNQGNQIQNENRRSNEEQLKRQEEEVKNRLYKSSELYRNLTKLQAQQNSANADAIKSGLTSNGDKVSKAIASQTSVYKAQAKEAKKSSLLKWMLFGGIAYGVTKLLGGVGAVGKLIENGFGVVAKGFHGVGEMLGILHDDNADMAQAEADNKLPNEGPEGASGKPGEGKFDQERKEKDSESIERKLDQDEKLKEKIGGRGTQARYAQMDAAMARSAARAGIKASAFGNKAANLKNEAKIGKGFIDEAKNKLIKSKDALKAAEASGDKKAIKSAEKAVSKAKGELKAARSLSRGLKLKSATASAINKLNKGAAKTGAIVGKGVSKVSSTIGKGVAKTGAIKGAKAVAKRIPGSKIASKAVNSRLSKYVASKLLKLLGIKAIAKTAGRAVPFVGLGIGAMAALRRISRGDWLGAFGELSSAAVAQLGIGGGLISGGAATVAGLVAAAGIDALILMHDQKLAREYAEKGELDKLLSMGFEPADIAELIYNSADEKGNPTPLHSSHPLRKAFESKYKTIASLAGKGGKALLPAIVLAQGLLDKSSPLYKDYEKNYSSVKKLLDRKFDWVDIAELVQSSDVNSPLFKDFMNYYDQAVPFIMSKDSRTNNNAILLGKIAKKSTGEFRAKFQKEYGNPDEFISKHERIKGSPWSKTLRFFKWSGDKLAKAGKWAFKLLSSPFKSIGSGIMGAANFLGDTYARLTGSTNKRLEKEKLKNAAEYVAKENGIIIDDSGTKGTVTTDQFMKEYGPQVKERLKHEADPIDSYSKMKRAALNARDATKRGIKSAVKGAVSAGYGIGNGIISAGKWIGNAGSSLRDWFMGYAEGTNDPGTPNDDPVIVGEAPSKKSKYKSDGPNKGKAELAITPDGKKIVIPGDNPEGHVAKFPKGTQIKPKVPSHLGWASKIANKTGKFIDASKRAVGKFMGLAEGTSDSSMDPVTVVGNLDNIDPDKISDDNLIALAKQYGVYSDHIDLSQKEFIIKYIKRIARRKKYTLDELKRLYEAAYKDRDKGPDYWKSHKNDYSIPSKNGKGLDLVGLLAAAHGDNPWDAICDRYLDKSQDSLAHHVYGTNQLGNGMAPKSKLDFILSMRPLMYSVLSSKSFVPKNQLDAFATLLTAQSGLESAWGRSNLSAKYNNFSGMTRGTAKYHGQGAIYMTNSEGRDGNTYAKFKDVNDWADDFVEYVNRKFNAFSHGVDGYGNQLQGGSQTYATNPRYVNDLYSTFKSVDSDWTKHKGGTPQFVEAKFKSDGTSQESQSDNRTIEDILNGMVTQLDAVNEFGKSMKLSEGTANLNSGAIQKAKAAGWNMIDSIKHLESHAHKRSQHMCAKYVRRALEAGGINTSGRPHAATKYDKFLPKLGFEVQNPDGYKPQAGDISVIKAKGIRHPYGHISMFTGQNWISDFVQNDKSGDVYHGTGGPIIYFRYKALGNSNPGDLSQLTSYGSESESGGGFNATPSRMKSMDELISEMFNINTDSLSKISQNKDKSYAWNNSDAGSSSSSIQTIDGLGDAPLSSAKVTKPIQSNITQIKREDQNKSIENDSKDSKDPQKVLVDNSGGNTVSNSFNTVNNHYHNECKIEQERNPLSNLMNS